MNINQKKQRVSKYVSFSKTKGNIDIFGEKQFHDYYEFYLLLNGKVEFLNDHMRYQIPPYTLVIIPPGVYHQFIVLNDPDSYERYVLNVHPDILGETLMTSALSDKEIFVLSDEHRIIENFLHLDKCLDIMNKDDFSHLLSSVAIDVVFSVKYLCSTSKINQEKLTPLALKLMEYINKHYIESCSLEELSKRFSFSVSSIAHTFKRNFGISIKKYLQQKRMCAINYDLKNGEKPEQLAYKYNFNNYSTFYRAYKKYFGVSPSIVKKLDC